MNTSEFTDAQLGDSDRWDSPTEQRLAAELLALRRAARRLVADNGPTSYSDTRTVKAEDIDALRAATPAAKRSKRREQ